MSQLIMVIDDHEDTRTLFNVLLSEEGYRVKCCSEPLVPHGGIRSTKPDLLIVDQLFAHDRRGWDLIQQLKSDPATTRVPVILCVYPSPALDELNQELNAQKIEVVLKPFDIDDMLEAIKKALNTCKI
ncbi:MAG TPA: response regulator [Chloroflexia bacterium]|nr:response regulator [Chloroflexia bacterium]